MLVLNDAGVGGLGVGVVDHRVALVVVGVQHLGLKADAAVCQRPQLIAEVGVDGAGVDHPVGQSVQGGLFFQIVHPEADFDPLQHPFDHGGVAAVRDALIEGVEVVVVVGKADRQPPDDEGGQLGAGAAPLLGGVALDQLFVDVGAHQADGLLFQVFGLGDAGGGPLLLDLCFGLGGGHHTPHPVEGVHVEGHVVNFALVVRDGAVGVAVEVGELPRIVPHLLRVGVEDVRAVAVDVDPLHLLSVDIAGDVAPPVDDQALFARAAGLPGKDRAEQPGPHDEIIVLLHAASPCARCARGFTRGRRCPFSGRRGSCRWPRSGGCGPARGRYA